MKILEHFLQEEDDHPMLIRADVFPDERGDFIVGFDYAQYLKHGIIMKPVYESISSSVRGVIRGLHTQIGREQSKLVRCVHGKILDVAVDVRRGSKTFGRAAHALVNETTQFYVPKGFLHGFQALSERAIVVYFQDEGFFPETEQGIYCGDGALGIPWWDIPPIISKKDSEWPTLEEAIKKGLL